MDFISEIFEREFAMARELADWIYSNGSEEIVNMRIDKYRERDYPL